MPPNFTGRKTELQMLSDWLNGDNLHPLFVLRALGGFGKSALTWHWLTNEVDSREWPQVVWWSFYEASADFNTFLRRTLAYLIGHEPDLPPRQQLDSLLMLLQHQQVLLVMDGFERELRAYSNMGAAYQGDEISPNASNGDTGSSSSTDKGGSSGNQSGRDCINPFAEIFLHKIVSLPNLKGKVLMSTRLRPRPVEKYGGILLQGCWDKELTQMEPDDALTFFRKQGIRGSRTEIQQACDAYGYHPLSLRLLAGLVANDFRNPGDIKAAENLDLTGDLVQQQHHVLEQSYQTLGDVRRQLLSRIACFRSPVDFAVLEAVTCKVPEEDVEVEPVELEKPGLLGRFFKGLFSGESPQTTVKKEGEDNGYSSRELEADLRNLTSRGLLHFDQRKSRFDLHPIVRRYAYDRMATPDRTAAHAQLRDYFAAVPEPDKVETLEDLTPVIELYHHMVRAGQYDKARKLFSDRIDKPTYYQFGAYQLQIELLRALFPEGEDKPPNLKNKHEVGLTLNDLASVYSLSSQPAKAMPLYERYIAISQRRNDKTNEAIGLDNLALTQLLIGALQAAEDNLRRAIALCQEIEKEFQEVVAHKELGRLLAYRGAWTDAEEELTTALDLDEKNSPIQAQTLLWAYRALSALLKVRAGEAQVGEMALAAAERSLELADEDARTTSPVERDYFRAHWVLGAAQQVNGNPSQSDTHLSEALTRCRNINSVDTEADVLLDLARLRADQGQSDEALRLAEEAQIITERCGYVLQGADVHLFLAQQALARGDKAQALAYAETALRLATCDGGEYTYKVAYEEATALLQQLR